MEESELSSSRSTLWELGILAPWQLRDDQLPVYLHLLDHRKPFLECARRYGKTTTILIYVIEKLRSNPGWVCRWVLPEKEQARTIIKPEIDRIQADCPDSLCLKWHHVDSYYEAPNGSKLFLYGVDKDKGKRLRGPFAHIVVCDEYGFWNDPTVVERILMPQLLTTRGQIIIASTPSEDLAHAYYFKREEAERELRLIQKTIYDNKSLTDEDIDQAKKDSGGEASPIWQREYLLNPMPDPTKLVIPEYTEELCLIPDDHPRPELFDAYVGGDSGADDNTAIFFGYYDFHNDIDVVEQEFVTRGKTSEEIVNECKQIELELWGEKKPFVRVYDAPKQLLLDITGTHKYSVVLPAKDDKHAAIHQWRRRVQQGKFRVKRRCRHLHRQMKVGMWKDERHTDFERSDELGHLDAIAGGLYFSRAIVRSRNPWPANHGYDPRTQFVSPIERNLDKDRGMRSLEKAFRPPNFRRG